MVHAWTEAEILKLKELRDEGVFWADIREALGIACSKNTLANRLRFLEQYGLKYATARSPQKAYAGRYKPKPKVVNKEDLAQPNRMNLMKAPVYDPRTDRAVMRPGAQDFRKYPSLIGGKRVYRKPSA